MAHLKINNPSKGAVSAACLQHACFSKKIGEHPGKLFSNLLELAAGHCHPGLGACGGII